jgi:hypothetical protein
VVLHVLLLLAVTRWFLQSLDDHAGSGGQDFNGGNSVLNSQLDTHAKAGVIGRCLNDIVVNLLGGNTERTDLLGEG